MTATSSFRLALLSSEPRFKILRHCGVAFGPREVESCPRAPIACVDVGAVLHQILCNMDVAFPRCLHQGADSELGKSGENSVVSQLLRDAHSK